MKIPSETSSAGVELSVPGAPPQPPAAAAARKDGRLPTLWSAYGPTPERSGLMLEPDYVGPYREYTDNRSPETAGRLLEAVNPILDEALRSYGGSEAPTVTARARAKRMALEAVDRYDPRRAKLRTHLLSHLRGLRRVTERSVAGVYVPEQWRLDSRIVDATHADLSDELGRDPSDGEISDRLGIPIDRVRKARSVPGALASSQYDGTTAAPSRDEAAWNSWVDGIYHDLPPVDQVILEHSFGLHGKPVLPAKDIAAKVRLSGGAVSQRKAKIQQMLDEFDAFFGRK